MLRTHHNAFDEQICDSVDEFCDGFLKGAGIVESVLREPLVQSIEERLGKPDPGEVYIPVPYPWLGGSGEPNTYTKGDVWVYASLSGQSW